MKVEIKQLNNKTRKGRYVYIKEKGIRGRYYKYDPTIELDYYIERYKDGTERIGMQKYKETRPIRETKKIIRKLRSKPRLSKQISKGSKKITRELKEMNNINSINEYEKLLRPLVLNKKLMKIIIQNREKLTVNLTHEVIVKGIIQDTNEYGELARLKYHNISIEKLRNKLQGLKENMIITSKTLEQFAINKSTIKYNKKGLARQITVTTKFNK